ncbi:MAG TPA: heparinase II/III family protein [Candidatus Binatia bacterium]|jgi:hypothetical protein|nr:heparinase II/III family protein [Candidatus Binatia bacterium]
MRYFALLRRAKTSCLVRAFLCSVAFTAPAATNLEPAQVEAVAKSLPAKPMGSGQPITNRDAWEKLAQAPAFASVITSAQTMAKDPVPALPDELYLDYSKTGNRDRCQKVLSARGNRLVTFTLAEGLENRGRFLGPLTETIEAICRERTWVYPAHDGKLNNFYGRTVEMDLRATAMGWELATLDYVLGDKLAPSTRSLIRDNVRRRVLRPFRDMVEGRRSEINWLRIRNNWNAVCLAGVTGAALALEDSPQDRAFFVAATEHYIAYFLSGFTPDGYCSEGVGYWNYGFGHFLMLGETIRQATGGRVDLLAEPAALQPALFCRRSEILNGIYPTISDVSPGSRPDAQFVRFICERFALPKPAAEHADFVKPAGSLAATLLFSFLPSPLPPAPHPPIAADSRLRTWFKEGGVLLCRPAPGSAAQFAAALKGGNNAENHNHNDVGSFSAVSGKSMVICDPGAEVYTARTFSAHRYDSKVLSSYGHAVPVIAGELQRAGAEARAVVLHTDFRDDEDTLVLDIRSAYKVPELKKLERTFVFHRSEAAALTVRDEVEFSEPRSFASTLVTWGNWKKISENELLITDEQGAARVAIDTGGRGFKLDSETLNEDVHTPKKPVRLLIALEAPVEKAVVTLRITPATRK